MKKISWEIAKQKPVDSKHVFVKIDLNEQRQQMEAVACLNWKTPECRLSLTLTTCAVFNTNFWCVCNKHVCYKCCFTIIMNFFSFWFYSSFENNNVFFGNIHLMAHKKTIRKNFNSKQYMKFFVVFFHFGVNVGVSSICR